MSEDPFDDFRKIEKMFRRVIEGADTSLNSTGYSVSIKRVGGKTEVNVKGDISEDDVKMLKRKYPDAEIKINDRNVEDSQPVEVVDEESAEDSKDEKKESSRRSEIEVVGDEEEVDPSELALKRFKEKKDNEKD